MIACRYRLCTNYGVDTNHDARGWSYNSQLEMPLGLSESTAAMERYNVHHSVALIVETADSDVWLGRNAEGWFARAVRR